MIMLIWIGLHAPKHVGPSQEYVYDSPVGWLHTNLNSNQQLCSPLLKQSSWAHQILAKPSYLCAVYLGTSGIPTASVLYEDNNTCIAMAMTQKPMPWTWQMDIKYHILIEWVEWDLLQLERINTSKKLADNFTKQLGCTLFHQHVDYILGKVPPTYSCAFDRFHLGLHKYAATTPLVQKPACSPLPNTFAAVAVHLWTSWSQVIGSIL